MYRIRGAFSHNIFCGMFLLTDRIKRLKRPNPNVSMI